MKRIIVILAAIALLCSCALAERGVYGSQCGIRVLPPMPEDLYD